MSEKKPEHPAVKIVGAVGAFIFITVLMLAVLAPEHLSIVGWIVIPRKKLLLNHTGIGMVHRPEWEKQNA